MWMEISVDNWVEFLQHVEVFKKRDWIFRGQSNAKWSLQTSFYREMQKAKLIGNPSEKYLTYERSLIHEFLRSAHLYASIQPKEPEGEWPDNKTAYTEYRIEIMSIMQHHGAPTRLLDWTFSPYIATFFALDGAGENRFCVYALNQRYIQAKNKSRFTKKDFVSDALTHTSRLIEPFVVPYEPYYKNERLRKQLGLFIVPHPLEMTVDEIFTEYGIVDGVDPITNEEVALKFIFDTSLQRECWSKLTSMGVTHENIYPGLDGFCKSLKLDLLESPLKRLSLY